MKHFIPSHLLLRLMCLIIAAGAGWIIVYGLQKLPEEDLGLTKKVIALVFIVGVCGFSAVCMLAWAFFYDRLETRQQRRQAETERAERRKPAKEKLAEAREEQRSERNANYILGAVVIAISIYFLFDKEWLVAGLMAAVAAYLLYNAIRNIEPAEIKQKREEATRRQEVETLMETAKDDGAVIIVDHVDSLTAIEEAIEAFGEEYLGRKNGRNTIRLWQLERNRYALTFPLGYQPEAPMALMDELDIMELHPTAWFPSRRLKTHGEWTMLRVGQDSLVNAVTDTGLCFSDEGDYRLSPDPQLHLAFQPRPNITNNNPKKLEDFT